ncbi:MAG: ATP-dependent DNA helicase [Planctomycetaceae bacterium]|jgi:ATP-dependent DNA helicase RecQ|nr:ATP-dependent DNA helicase [Planctomycetaceae bacterium]
MSDCVYSVLFSKFGIREFRSYQEEVIRAILSGRDVFTVMPTGGGKSLCYQLPACLMEGVCVVVSPLISLMKDQVDSARLNGLSAGTLNSSISSTERAIVGDLIRRKSLDLLYISPERFNSEYFISRLKRVKIAFFAIDEAHCISEWGHDFRPDYLSLSKIIQEFPDVPVTAFTATATPRVVDDIIARLGLRNPHLTRASFNRPNLFYRVIMKQNLQEQILSYVKKRVGESGIIYCSSRKKVEETTLMLRFHGISASYYHAGLNDEQRSEVQESFRHGGYSVIVATIAFGMGIDKSDVRFVIHADLPKSVEGYYQETGRAGRDGEAAECILFFSRGDVAQQMQFANKIEDEKVRNIAKEQLWQMVRLAEQRGCRRVALLDYFSESFVSENCNACDICVNEGLKVDATISAQKVLSLIYRTRESFGAAHLADVLIGANTEKIRQFGHDKLPTYGVGKDKTKNYWRAIINELIAQKITRIEDDSRPVPKLTDEAWLIIRGQKNFTTIPIEDRDCGKKSSKGRIADSFKQSKNRTIERDQDRDQDRDRNRDQDRERNRDQDRDRDRASDLVVADDLFSELLFARLREVRTELAREGKVPPYIIFSDKTLREFSRFFPMTPEELLSIRGVGQYKYETYGQRFLDTIIDFYKQNPEETEKWKKNI